MGGDEEAPVGATTTLMTGETKDAEKLKKEEPRRGRSWKRIACFVCLACIGLIL